MVYKAEPAHTLHIQVKMKDLQNEFGIVC